MTRPSPLPASLRVVDCCPSCEHCFVKVEYEAEAECYCTIDGPRPKPCGSILQGESFCEKQYMADHLEITPEGYAARKNWRTWAKAHHVEHDNVCDHYLRVENGDAK